jgi:hypothetical protein
MGVIMTREHIRYDHGPSLILPFRPNPFETAGLTKIIVDEPVIANTVHINATSRYHAPVQRSGICLGPMNCFHLDDKVERNDDDDDGDDLSFVVRNRRYGLPY